MVRFGGRCGGDIPGKSGGSGGEEKIVSKGRFINDITDPSQVGNFSNLD